MDPKIIQVALSGLENILRVGEQDAATNGINHYAVLIEECFGKYEIFKKNDLFISMKLKKIIKIWL